MPNREEAFGAIRRQWEQTGRRRELFADLAREMSLKPFRRPNASIWIEQDQGDEHYPTHFYSERYTQSGEPTLKEHKITFPVPDLPTFRENLDALDTLYISTYGSAVLIRHELEGFMDFLEEFEKDQEQKRLEEDKK